MLTKGDRPFECEICNIKFSHKFALKAHILSHEPNYYASKLKQTQLNTSKLKRTVANETVASSSTKATTLGRKKKRKLSPKEVEDIDTFDNCPTETARPSSSQDSLTAVTSSSPLKTPTPAQSPLKRVPTPPPFDHLDYNQIKSLNENYLSESNASLPVLALNNQQQNEKSSSFNFDVDEFSFNSDTRMNFDSMLDEIEDGEIVQNVLKRLVDEIVNAENDKDDDDDCQILSPAKKGEKSLLETSNVTFNNSDNTGEFETKLNGDLDFKIYVLAK